MRIYAAIRKFDEARRLVWGYASTEALDAQGEIIKREAVEAALPNYMRFGNIREMHQASAVGVATDAEMDDRGLHLKVKVIDDDAWRKVEEGVYKGFSIGGRVTERDRLERHIVTGCEISEISLVDRPANAECVFDIYKVLLPALPEGEDERLDPSGLDGLIKSQRFLLEKIGKMGREIEALRQGLARIGQAPAPAKGVLKVLAKGEEIGHPAEAEPADARAAIARAHRRPIPATQFLMGR